MIDLRRWRRKWEMKFEWGGGDKLFKLWRRPLYNDAGAIPYHRAPHVLLSFYLFTLLIYENVLDFLRLKLSLHKIMWTSIVRLLFSIFLPYFKKKSLQKLYTYYSILQHYLFLIFSQKICTVFLRFFHRNYYSGLFHLKIFRTNKKAFKI